MPQHQRVRSFSVGAAVLALAISIGLSGCASSTTYAVKVDAMANRTTVASGYSYTLDSKGSKSASRDPRSSSVAEHVKLALSQRGMFEAANPADADIVVDFDFGEHAPQTHVTTHQEPTMVLPGQNYPGQQVNQSTITAPPITIGPGGSRQQQGIDPYYNGRNNTNQTQVVMVETTRVTQTTEKYIRISGRENAASKARPKSAPPAEQLWTVEATVEDESSDFDKCLPAMIDAAVDYIGVSTRGQQKVVVKLGS